MSFPPEVDEHPTEVVFVFFHSVVERFDLFLVEEAQHPPLQLTRPLAGDDLDLTCLYADRLVDDLCEREVDQVAAVIDVVQVELEPGHSPDATCQVPDRGPRYGSHLGPGRIIGSQGAVLLGCRTYGLVDLRLER